MFHTQSQIEGVQPLTTRVNVIQSKLYLKSVFTETFFKVTVETIYPFIGHQ